MQEAEIEETDTGRMPAGDGWFILNVKDFLCFAVNAW